MILFTRFLFPLFLFASALLHAENISLDSIRESLPAFERYVQESMLRTHVPGVAIAIVYNKKVVYIKGFGERKVGESKAVNPDTIFQIASLSKPMTSTVIAALVGENKIGWDTRISQIDPAFQLSAAWVSSELTLADLLSHRSGLPDQAGDLLEDLGFDQKTILNRLRLEPLSNFRTEYKYTNFGYTEAALAAAKAVGLSWDALAHQKLLDPLKMNITDTKYQDFQQRHNRAELHVIRGNVAKQLYQRNPDAQSPAGGFSTSMSDFSKWMVLQLSDGIFEGKQIISAKALAQTHEPLISTGENTFYGLGWGVGFNDQGQKILSHTGMFNLGVHTCVELIPEQKFGIAVFANASMTGIANALVAIFMDLVEKKAVEKDWISVWNERFRTLFGEAKTVLPTPKNLSPALPLHAYIGDYSNAYFGVANISLQENKLYLKLGPNAQAFELTPFNRDVFTLSTRAENASGITPVIFTVDEVGIACRFVIQAFNASKQAIFIRR